MIADLHGHLDLLERLLATIDQYDPQARIVTLGDYVDNGPQTLVHARRASRQAIGHGRRPNLGANRSQRPYALARTFSLVRRAACHCFGDVGPWRRSPRRRLGRATVLAGDGGWSSGNSTHMTASFTPLASTFCAFQGHGDQAACIAEPS
ncbi:hypothetical protein [Allochromatium humboldtianum]|uniref:hypothetical protein n=1 Tax=Allochromatium humboldtianum TaxID=504901 RepID=UPI0031B5ED43